MLAAQASGRAINVLTPGGALGEATKVAMLVGHAPRARIVSSIVLYNLATLYLSVVVLALGVPLTAAARRPAARVAADRVDRARRASCRVIALAVLIRRGALGDRAGRRAQRARCSRRRACRRGPRRSSDLDRSSASCTPTVARHARAASRCWSLARLCSWSATTTVLHAVGAPISATLLVGVFSVGILIGWVSSIVPLGVGIADGGNYALFGVLGASGAHGVVVTLLGRARSLTVA